jgi:hypothetical protein
MPTPETLRLIAEWRQQTAGEALTPRQAMLYSQRLRREMGQPGLFAFEDGGVGAYLEEALWLVQCALIERAAEPAGQWRLGIKRAGDILEFLSQGELRPAAAPIHLLAAGAYQVAGFPAMALAQLARRPADVNSSALLWTFLRADFPATLEQVRTFWSRQRDAAQPAAQQDSIAALTSRHVVMCIGTICSYFKTGNRTNADRAIEKLHALAGGYLLSRDPYSHLLAALTALAAEEFVRAAMWERLGALLNTGQETTRAAFHQYARSAFVNRRALVWPAQSAGVGRLAEDASFVLCTPTGSGKTTVAALAAVQGLFTPPVRPLGLENLEPDNLVLYLVPSRALAAEVERRLAEDLQGIAARPVVVTGLYGGVDWGPTDAWIQSESPTVVICTFEKADALLRYLGVLFLHRVRLVIIDEAHMVEHSPVNTDSDSGSSRALRLELLGTRLLEASERQGFRIIALSAVAATAAPALARWITGRRDALPTSSSHRSTRQILGKVEVGADGQFRVVYSLMDGRPLRFRDRQQEQTPYVERPFPALPVAPDFASPEKTMQSASLWAALHLASGRTDGSKPSVLISVTQKIGPFAEECIRRLEEWPVDRLPAYREAEYENDPLVRSALAIAGDYFGINSVEYRLLQRGIAVHHGKMPGLLGRRLKTLIDAGVVRVTIATSTLSEGVNIPVTYLLIPNLYRATTPLSLQEFSNLIGRAGRPGVATEGHALVLVPEAAAMPVERGRRKQSRQRREFDNLITRLEAAAAAGAAGAGADNAASALSDLLSGIESAWRSLFPGGTAEQFAAWLEQTSVTEGEGASQAVQRLDSLDAFLIASIHEVEGLRLAEIPAADLEPELIRIWQKSYAFAAVHDEGRLRRIWLTRGRVLKELYPDRAARRQIYRSSLSPRSALRLAERVAAIRERLLLGVNYADWNAEDRLTFVGNVLELIAEVPSFRIGRSLGRDDDFDDWRGILRWWVAKQTLIRQPTPKQVATWYDYAAKNFIYRGAWGLGSVLSLLLDLEDGGQPIAALELDDWPRSGLPWSAFWLKEILTWGTLEPVAAYLLARGDPVDRVQAERDAIAYYEQLPGDIDANERLDPRRVRLWLNARAGDAAAARPETELSIDAALSRAQADYVDARVSVLHVETAQGLVWIDAAGYEVATSARPREWPAEPHRYQFVLDIAASRIDGLVYQPHR